MAIGFGETVNVYRAQTFVAGGEHLQSIDLSLRASLGPGEGKYHLLITTVKALAPNQFQPDQILAEVNGVPEPLDANPDFHKVHINLGGVTLVEGQTYAFVIDAIVTRDGVNDSTNLGYKQHRLAGLLSLSGPSHRQQGG